MNLSDIERHILEGPTLNVAISVDARSHNVEKARRTLFMPDGLYLLESTSGFFVPLKRSVNR